MLQASGRALRVSVALHSSEWMVRQAADQSIVRVVKRAFGPHRFVAAPKMKAKALEIRPTNTFRMSEISSF